MSPAESEEKTTMREARRKLHQRVRRAWRDGFCWTSCVARLCSQTGKTLFWRQELLQQPDLTHVEPITWRGWPLWHLTRPSCPLHAARPIRRSKGKLYCAGYVTWAVHTNYRFDLKKKEMLLCWMNYEAEFAVWVQGRLTDWLWGEGPAGARQSEESGSSTLKIWKRNKQRTLNYWLLQYKSKGENEFLYMMKQKRREGVCRP